MSAEMINISDMFQATAHANEKWGVEGYKVPIRHFDYAQQKIDKEYAAARKAAKATKPRFPPTKRGNFLDDI